MTKKIHSQPNAEVSTPPTSGPIATAPPIVAPQTPNAMPRSLPWNACAISASEVANIIAPPMPCKPRARFSNSGVVGEAAEQRGDGEDAEADHEHPPPPEQVGERAGRQQQRGERQRVGVDDPLQVGEAGVQVALDVGQRDVHDRDVEQQHEGRHADGDQRPALTVAHGARRAAEPAPGRPR